MRPITPNSNVAAVQGALEAGVEVSLVSPVADVGVYEVQTVTCPTKAACTAGDMFILENIAGDIMAVALNKAGNSTEPSGLLYSAADIKTFVDISSATTAIQVAALLKAAIDLAPLDDVTCVDNADGTLTFTQDLLGNATAPVRKNATEAGNGTFVVATATAGVDSAIQSKYFQFRVAAGTKYHCWMNVGGEGVDPAPAASTAIEVAVAAGASASTIATAAAAAINVDGHFAANVRNGSSIEIHNLATGNPTDVDAGDSTFSVSVAESGNAVGNATLNPGDAPSGISNNPSAIT